MIISSNNSYFKEWRKLVWDHLETNIPAKSECDEKQYFVKLSDGIYTLMEDKLYTQLDQFGGIEAASIGVSLTYDEYAYIEKEIGPVTKATVGQYALLDVAERVAEAMAFGVDLLEKRKAVYI